MLSVLKCDHKCVLKLPQPKNDEEPPCGSSASDGLLDNSVKAESLPRREVPEIQTPTYKPGDENF
jgi:hypothetical protein